MFKVTLKGILGHKARVVSTGLAVVLGVAFMAGTLIYTDTINTAFNDLFADVNAGTDAVVRSAESVESDFGGTIRSRVDAGLIERVRAIDGVTDAQGEIENFQTVILDADGDQVGGNAPQFGRVWSGEGPVSPWVLQDGSRVPEADNEVLTDVFTADLAGYEVGDTLPVITPNEGLVEYQLVGVVKFGTADGTLGATQVLFTLDEAQRVLAEPDVVDAIGVAADDGISEDELVARITAELEGDGVTDVEVITGAQLTEENQNDVASFLDIITIGLLGFAAISVVVGAFIIYNTFSILVAQRGRELALLRAVGATRRQVLQSIVLEAAVVGVVASIAGFFVGLLLSQLITAMFAAIGFEIPDVSAVIAPRTVVVSLVLGIGVTLLSATVPAIRASRVPPLAALRDAEHDTSSSSRVRTAIAVVTLGTGVASVVAGLAGGGTSLVFLGAFFLLVGVAAAGPILARPVAHLLGAPIQGIKGVTGRLARENAVRNPKRTSSTALALTIGVSVVVFIAIFAQSFKDTTRATFAEQFTGDLIVDSTSFGGTTGFDPAFTAEVADLDGVDQATGLRIAPARVADRELFLQAVDARAASSIFQTGGDPAQLAELGADGLAISEETAQETGWEIGTPLLVELLNGTDTQVTVEALYPDEELAGQMFVDVALFDAAMVSPDLDIQIFLTVDDGADVAAIAGEIEALLAPSYPIAEVQTLDEFLDAQISQIDQLLFLVYALLAFSCLLAGFGIANTLRLSIVERRREIGLSRAVGMTRSQVRSTFRWESVIVALFGTAMGLALGAFFGVSTVLALADDGFDLSMPVGTLVLIACFAAALGVVAAVRPARKAARLDVLGAIASQ